MGIESVDDWVVLLLCLNQKDRVWRRRLRDLNTRERENESNFFFVAGLQNL